MRSACVTPCVHVVLLARGLFMAKYVFPGADASMPLGWVVDQLEACGFEVQTMDTIGVHCTSPRLDLFYRSCPWPLPFLA